MGFLDENCRECDDPGTGVFIGNGKCNVCRGTGLDGFSKCRRCRGKEKCPRCNGRGYHPGSGPPYPPEGDDDEDDEETAEPDDDYSLPSSSTYTPASGSTSSSAAGAAKDWVAGFSGIYLWASAALWLTYFVAGGLIKLGVISPETAAALERWLPAFVQTPLGIALMLFFSIGLIAVGFFILKYVLIAVAVLIPVAIVIALIGIVLESWKQGPQNAAVPRPIPTVSGDFYHLPICADARPIRMSQRHQTDSLLLHEDCWTGPITITGIDFVNFAITSTDPSSWYKERYLTTANKPFVSEKFMKGDLKTDIEPQPMILNNIVRLRGRGTVAVIYTKYRAPVPVP